MRTLRIPSLTIVIASCFLLYAVAVPGCGSSTPSTGHLDQYDSLPYRDAFTFDDDAPRVYRAAIRALQQEGYVISLSDPQTGLISAELNSGQVIAEEVKDARPAESSGSNVFWTIIGIIFLFGLIAMIVGSSEETDNDQREDRSRPPRHDPPYEHEDTKTVSFRYIVTLNAGATGDFSTEVRISAVRMQLENGGVVRSERMENKYLNYRLADLVRNELGRK